MFYAVAAGLCLDALGVGLALGWGRISLSRGAFLLGAVCPGAVLALSLLCGRGAAHLLDLGRMPAPGGILLAAVGLWMAAEGLRPASEPKRGILGLLHRPAGSDRDRSGRIEAAEALPLALALSADLPGAGLALGTMQGWWSLPLLVGLGHPLLLWCGLRLGKRLPPPRWGAGSLCTGCLLAVVGLLQLLGG